MTRPFSISSHVRYWTDRDVWGARLRLWSAHWGHLRARIAYARVVLINRVSTALLLTLDRHNILIPDRVFRIVARLNGFRWPDDPHRAAIRMIYYNEPPIAPDPPRSSHSNPENP